MGFKIWFKFFYLYENLLFEKKILKYRLIIIIEVK